MTVHIAGHVAAEPPVVEMSEGGVPALGHRVRVDPEVSRQQRDKEGREQKDTETRQRDKELESEESHEDVGSSKIAMTDRIVDKERDTANNKGGE